MPAERLSQLGRLETRFAIPGSRRTVEASRKSIVRAGLFCPGFVDSHTHPAFVSPRLTDFEKRIRGASYEEIVAAGGGIRSSVAAVRGAGKNAIAEKVLSALQQFAANGTTTAEAKSGYGLSLESELKSLEAIRAAAAKWPGTVVPTLLGAHVVPPEFSGRADDYVNLSATR